MSRRVAFRQADVERAMRAAKAVGCSCPTVEIFPDGRMRVLTAAVSDSPPADEFEAWERENGHRAA